jgi:hypothetical protein
MRIWTCLRAVEVTGAAVVVGSVTLALVPRASAAPAPEVEYVYDVMARRHYNNFANPTEAVDYGYGICDKVTRRDSYAQVMGDVKNDTAPNDEFAANYLVSYAVNLFAPGRFGSCATRQLTTSRRPAADKERTPTCSIGP